MATEAEIEQRAAKDAHETQERIKHYLGIIRQSWFKLAAELHEFEAGDMWKNLGYGSFSEWISDPDIELGGQRSWIYSLLSIYRELVLKRSISPEKLSHLSPGKLQEIMPAVRRGVDLEQALSDVRALSFSDIRERYSSGGAGAHQPPRASGSVPSTAPLNATTEPAYVKCPTCGSRVHETEIERT